MKQNTCSIAPLLSVRNGKKAVEFYKAAFGATEVFRVESPDGEVVARLSVNGAEFWVSDESPAHGNFSPETLGGGTVRMVMTVADPDAVFYQAMAAGATTVWPVHEEYGWRRWGGWSILSDIIGKSASHSQRDHARQPATRPRADTSPASWV